MDESEIRSVYVGGPWDGLVLLQPGVEKMAGRYVQFPYSERTLALLQGKRPDEEPVRPTHMSIYRYDDKLEGNTLYCRFEKSFSTEDWLAHFTARHDAGLDPYP
jgi:hypothetical protein